MEKLFSPSFWFNVRPGALSQGITEIFTIGVVALIALTLIFTLIKTRTKKSIYHKLAKSFHTFFLTNAIIGAFLLFFNYELIPFLSSRFLLLLWGIGIIVWLVFILKIFIAIPKRKKELAQEKEFKKYIP